MHKHIGEVRFLGWINLPLQPIPRFFLPSGCFSWCLHVIMSIIIILYTANPQIQCQSVFLRGKLGRQYKLYLETGEQLKTEKKKCVMLCSTSLHVSLFSFVQTVSALAWAGEETANLRGNLFSVCLHIGCISLPLQSTLFLIIVMDWYLGLAGRIPLAC